MDPCIWCNDPTSDVQIAREDGSTVWAHNACHTFGRPCTHGIPTSPEPAPAPPSVSGT